MQKHDELENKKGMSRRRFLSVMAGAGVVGAAATMTGCSPVSDPKVQAGCRISIATRAICRLK